MRTVGIKVLKNRLSEYVRAAGAGETVLVTDRDRVVAELVPPRSRIGRSAEEILAEGIREGWYTPAEADWRESIEDEPPPAGDRGVPFDRLMADLAKDREDR